VLYCLFLFVTGGIGKGDLKILWPLLRGHGA